MRSKVEILFCCVLSGVRIKASHKYPRCPATCGVARVALRAAVVTARPSVVVFSADEGSILKSCPVVFFAAGVTFACAVVVAVSQAHVPAKCHVKAFQ